ncbi:MAG: tRNA 2-thiouridine(34) synthase MnmA [Thermodesulfobacteriota bacterium]
MRVAVAMSGGVDSTATALMLKEQGHEVLGLHMRLHEGSDKTWLLAQAAGERIGIEVQLVDLSAEFSREVIEPFVAGYRDGLTPSPCPVCNRSIKMGALYERAASLGCDRLATGHYAQIAEGPALIKGVDRKKDQSYFLFALTRDMLSRTLFPLGGFTKAQVREWLAARGVVFGPRDESQELCFIPDRDYRRFLAEHGVGCRPGVIKDLQGRVIGQHPGIINYTVGQRRGMGIPGPEPLYVVAIDPREHVIVAGPKRHAFVDSVEIGQVNVLVETPLHVGERLTVKIRSTAVPVWCTVAGASEDSAVLRFEDPQAGVAPGQAAVLYDGDQVIAGGWIRPKGRSRDGQG